jgi:molybdopterin converting factor subunit 1
MPSPLHVRVTFYASLREMAGVESVPLELPNGSVLGDVWPLLKDRFPKIAGMESSLAWAVNHSYAKLHEPLADGDEIAALPPISGGSEERDQNG